MSVRRKAAATAVLGVVPLALTGLTATPAHAHGSMSDPVSRVAACYAEGPESPQSAACKAAVAASGTQALYDWNEVNIGDAAGRHREIIPDGKLCSAGRDKYKGLDLARADWPSSPLNSGPHTFRYTATAPHKGSFALYLTKDGYDPAEPLAWADLESEPFAEVTDPKLEDGAYVFDGTVPEKSGRHLIYSVWQRSDSPEAFYTCSDVTFGGSGGGGGSSQDGAEQEAGSGGQGGEQDEAPAAPTEEQIEQDRDKSTVDHGGHGGEHAGHEEDAGHGGADEEGGNAPEPAGGSARDDSAAGEDGSGVKDVDAQPVSLAETGGDSSTPMLAAGGAAVLVAGVGLVALTLRRRAGSHRA